MTWQVGDLAVCIKSGICTREGVIYTVAHVHAPGEWLHGFLNDCDEVLLSFAEIGITPNDGSAASRFRKVQHDKREACESEFRILLQLSKKRANA